jgi:hypothetical protein
LIIGLELRLGNFNGSGGGRHRQELYERGLPQVSNILDTLHP